ncbi:hypothetical protein ACWEN4_13695 [Streptomyces violaceorubidus]
MLTLRPDGTAEASRMPVSSGAIGEGTACDGLGTWFLVRAGQDDRYRDGVLVHLDGDCGQESDWTIGGTEQDPELFVFLGDPDAGDLRILTRD